MLKEWKNPRKYDKITVPANSKPELLFVKKKENIKMIQKRIPEKEIEELYERFQTPPHVIAHCREVTRVAYLIAEKLNQSGIYNLDLDLVRGAGLTHDVARTSDEHWNVGADALQGMGYEDEAKIVRQHMFHQFNPLDELNELDMICFGDRLVKEHDYVGIDMRFQYIMDKAKNRPGAVEQLQLRREEMRLLLSHIEKEIGISIDALCKK